MKEGTRKIQNYRGVRPAMLICVLEGDGTAENPYKEVQYAATISWEDGIDRPVTLGKLVPLTDEEKSWFS